MLKCATIENGVILLQHSFTPAVPSIKTCVIICPFPRALSPSFQVIFFFLENLATGLNYVENPLSFLHKRGTDARIQQAGV